MKTILMKVFLLIFLSALIVLVQKENEHFLENKK
jgi:hypothetical protein